MGQRSGKKSTRSGLVTLADVEQAAKLLAGVARPTSLVSSGPLAAKLGGPAYLKCENLQRAGSFKVRGAFVRLARLSEAERAQGVVAASAGNHAQGVALAGSLLDTQVTVFMPHGAPLPKIAATRSYGARVEFAGQTVDEALVAARAFADETGAVFIHPFDHPDIIAGQGTVALEIFEQFPDVKTIVVACGGGGLLAGTAAVAAEINPQVEVVGVQAAGASTFGPSLAAGRPVALPQLTTIADGIAVGRPGDVTFEHVKAHVNRVLTVSDEQLSRALLFCLERSKLVVEPAGVAGVAAVLAEPTAFVPPVAIILSGGNIDPLLLLRVIEHGLAAAGRYLTVTVRAADRPGSLAQLLRLIADEGGNVLDVWHFRHDSQLLLGEADISLSIETRGNEHSERLLGGLRAAGFAVHVH